MQLYYMREYVLISLTSRFTFGNSGVKSVNWVF